MEEEKTTHNDAFNYDGYRVVCGEFFAHTHEPSITFNNQKISMNTACLKHLPDVEYVHILINADERKLVVHPCSESEKDAITWCSKNVKRSPRQIICRMFYSRVMSMMGWNPDYRYKVLGKLIYGNGKRLLAFDLSTPNAYQRIFHNGGKAESIRIPMLVEKEENYFGQPVAEHTKRYLVKTFTEHTTFNSGGLS